MDTKQAKDFLVERTVQQAALDGVPLSDLEKRMMYYVEGNDATPDDGRLNDQFDARYDTAEYEAKIGRLLHNAYVRVNKSDPGTARQWDDSVRFLAKGDHYISILWRTKCPKERPPHDSLKLLGSAIVVFCVFMLIAVFADRMSRSLPHFPIPGWIVRRLVGIFLIGLYFGLRYIAKRRRSHGQANSEIG